MPPKYRLKSLCDQNCGIQLADRQTEVKTDGPKILSKDIFYFKTVIIGGPIKDRGQQTSTDLFCFKTLINLLFSVYLIKSIF